MFESNMDVLGSAVLSMIKHPHSDLYALELLVRLVQRDTSFLRKVMEVLASDKYRHEGNLLFDRLWGLDNYMECITAAVKVLEGKSLISYHSDSLLETLISVERTGVVGMREKKLLWQRKYIAENCNNADSMSVLFRTLCEGSREQFLAAIICFCEHNKDLEAFMALPTFPRVTSWSGSEIPHIDKDIGFLTELMAALKGLDYIEHRIYIDGKIQSLRQYKEQTITREFLERH